MKKLFSLNLCVFFLLLSVFALSACEEPQPKEPVVDFSAEFQINVGDMTVTGDFSNTRQGVMSLCITSPDTLSGIKYNYKNGGLELSLDGLTCTAAPDYLPDGNYVSQIYDCMTLLKNEENYTYKTVKEDKALFEAGEGEYKIYTQKDTGEILKIESDTMTAEFSNCELYQ